MKLTERDACVLLFCLENKARMMEHTANVYKETERSEEEQEAAKSAAEELRSIKAKIQTAYKGKEPLEWDANE